MQNQQEATFVFGDSVSGFLRRYKTDAKFAQEARKKAAGVLDGSVQLICPDDTRPHAIRLLARLVNSETVLFSFYTKTDPALVKNRPRAKEKSRRSSGSACKTTQTSPSSSSSRSPPPPHVVF